MFCTNCGAQVPLRVVTALAGPINAAVAAQRLTGTGSLPFQTRVSDWPSSNDHLRVRYAGSPAPIARPAADGHLHLLICQQRLQTRIQVDSAEADSKVQQPWVPAVAELAAQMSPRPFFNQSSSQIFFWGSDSHRNRN